MAMRSLRPGFWGLRCDRNLRILLQPQSRNIYDDGISYDLLLNRSQPNALDNNMAKTIGFISEKGGVGKTTACFEIAISLHRDHKKRVLIVDADYQRGGITGRLKPSLLRNFQSGVMTDTTIFHKFQQLYSASTSSPNVTVVQSNFGINFLPADPRLSSISVDKLPGGKTIKQNSQQMFKHLTLVGDVLSSFQEDYDYILVDSHPEVSDLLRSVIYACDYVVSPVKLDLQSAIGVPTVIGEITSVNQDVEMIKIALGVRTARSPTVFTGAIGMMAREWGGDLKSSEETEYRRLQKVGTVFDHYVTEGDGIRRAAQDRTTVRDINIQNAQKQANQFFDITNELIGKCP